MQEIHAIFIGHVQGVGFRYTTKRYAQRHNIIGWVKNKEDGIVEMIAQGEKENLDALLKDINRIFKNYISDKTITNNPIINHEPMFYIKR